MPRPAQAVCSRGHVKAETGVYGRGRCKICTAAENKEAARKRRAAKRTKDLCGALPLDSESTTPCTQLACHSGLHDGGEGSFRKIVWGSSARSKRFATCIETKRSEAPVTSRRVTDPLAALRAPSSLPAGSVGSIEVAHEDISSEIWKLLPGSEDRHEVSDFGRVRSWRTHMTAELLETPRLLSPQPCRLQKYLLVSVWIDGKCRSKNIGHLVALTFIGPRPIGLITRHLNDNGYDNRVANIAYGTQRDNALDSIRNNTVARGELRGRAKLTEAIVREIRASSESTRTLARRFGVGYKTINGVIARETWKHIEETK